MREELRRHPLARGPARASALDTTFGSARSRAPHGSAGGSRSGPPAFDRIHAATKPTKPPARRISGFFQDHGHGPSVNQSAAPSRGIEAPFRHGSSQRRSSRD
jgi:hypothetical protein